MTTKFSQVVKRIFKPFFTITIVILFVLFIRNQGNALINVDNHKTNNVTQFSVVKKNQYDTPLRVSIKKPITLKTFFGNTTSISTFIGTITGYGPDCAGCGGFTSCRTFVGSRSGQDLRNGNIYLSLIHI